MNNEKTSQLREDLTNYFTLLKEMLERDDDMCQLVYGLKAIMDLGRARVAVDKMLKLIQNEE